MILSIDWQINFVGLDMNWRNVSSNEDLCFSLCGAYAASVFFYIYMYKIKYREFFSFSHDKLQYYQIEGN